MNIDAIRKEFHILEEPVNGVPLIYLDNAATTQVPESVLNALISHYRRNNANVHRGVHTLSERSSDAYENARKKVKYFLGAESEDNIVFTQGATDSLNLLAYGLEDLVNEGDEVICSELEHHANFVPWQQLCRRKRALFKVIPQQDGELDIAWLNRNISPKTRIVACCHVSNVTGTVNQVNEICAIARKFGALTVIDGAQALRHGKINVRDLGCDFYCFSGHKIMAPCGIGVLYGKMNRLKALRPYRFGGGMVDIVQLERSTFKAPPLMLEAGTGSYSEAIALGAALDYICSIGLDNISGREQALLNEIEQNLRQMDGIRILGTPARRAGCISFTAEGAHAYDIAKLLDAKGIAIRSGSFCAQPALQSFGCDSAVRVSPAFYNTFDEINSFAAALCRILELLRNH